MDEDRNRKEVNEERLKQLKMYMLSFGFLAILNLMNKLFPSQDNNHNSLAVDRFAKKLGNVDFDKLNIGPSEVLEILHECESWMDEQN